MQVFPPKQGSRGFILAFLSSFASCGDLAPEAFTASAPLGSRVQVMVAVFAAGFTAFFVGMDLLSNHCEVIIGDVLSRVQKKIAVSPSMGGDNPTEGRGPASGATDLIQSAASCPGLTVLYESGVQHS